MTELHTQGRYDRMSEDYLKAHPRGADEAEHAEGGSSRRPPALEEPFWGPLHHPWGENSCRSCRLDPVIHNADIAVGSRGTDGSNPVPSSAESANRSR